MSGLTHHRRHRRISRLTVMVVTTTLLTAAGSTASADNATSPKAPHASAVTEAARRAASAPSRSSASQAAAFGMFGIDAQGRLYSYAPDRARILAPREFLATDYGDVRTASSADDDGDGVADDTWVWTNDGGMSSSYGYVGGGWNIYDTVLSPGNLAGTPGYDVLGRDASGALWLYFGHGDGTVADRRRIGGGWDAYTRIAGKGDLTGDKWPDIVARDTSGALWLYQGTGDPAAPFVTRTKIGAGWNTYDALVAPGDIDLDGKADLIARQPNGDLCFYKGTGDAAAPFEAKRNIGSGYQTYRVLFS
ncbi:Repeat domain-containing protein [Streptomyces sp. 2112.3]|nr:VCBS repeat protein [Streptomyces sp. 2321.6]SDQ69758.1 Repeat domain-containing protein [Streptomyces sp. KS_16]SED40212.1 Repeat domain-containing protein [Streptomyces sp. 2112.3]SEE11896.1 Repeat domain-containing protein [Streptomyces sp. 2133.1]